MPMSSPRIMTALLLATALACGENEHARVDGGTSHDGGGPGDGGRMSGEGGVGDAGLDGSIGSLFTVRLENLSGATASPTPLSPGVWVVSPHANPLFVEDKTDRGDGLEHLAEDGNPSALASSLASDSNLAASGIFDTPVDQESPGVAAPGSAYEFAVTATPEEGHLAFATMFGQSNDVFFAPDGDGIALFDEEGAPIDEQDVSELIKLWDVGTERNQAPGMGPDQAPRQSSPDTGAAEGTIARFSDTTRALPIPSAIVDVQVDEDGGMFTLVIKNVSGDSHAIDTPISPVFYAIHDDTWQLFKPGSSARDGLESLAEDGSPADLMAAHASASGVAEVGAATTPDDASSAGPAATGESFTFSVQPNPTHPYLSIASMVGTTNDAFLALQPPGVQLLDEGGDPRPASKVQADIARALAVWDAGTEENEVPGIGPNQAPRQPAPNTGPADSDSSVRLYADATNDLEGAGVGGFASVTIVRHGEKDFDVTVSDTSGDTPFPGKLSPLVWALHGANTTLFKEGGTASSALEHLAEDGDPSSLHDALAGMNGVLDTGVVDTAQGASDAGPLAPGQHFQVTVTPDAEHRFLSLAAMVAPTNDTFIAFDPRGVALLHEDGSPRTDGDIAADVATRLFAWDAGTEANQSGAAGPDQVGHQSAPDTGASEGNSKVRALDDPVWPFPAPTDLIKVTITYKP